MPTIPADLENYASQAASLTGLDKNVILAQWISENGWATPAGYNFGNIMSNGKPAIYSSPSAGVAAYANLINTGSYYSGVRASVGQDAQTQIQAIASSPWDAGHYGGNGSILANVYNSIMGASIALPSGIQGPPTPVSTSSSSAPAVGLSGQLQSLQGVAQGTGSGWLAGAQSIGLMILLAGLGLIFLFVGLKMLSGGSPATIIKEAAKSE